MKKIGLLVISTILIGISFTACAKETGGNAVSESDLIYTQAVDFANTAIAQTQAVQQTAESAVTDTPEPTMTFTPEPTNTPAPTNTTEATQDADPVDEPQPENTEAPQTGEKNCFAASFEGQTVADGTRYPYEKEFTQTWRIKNTGSCAWDPGKIELIWVYTSKDGKEVTELLGGSSVIAFKNLETVYPNEYANVDVKYKLPKVSGTYQIEYKLRSQGTIFGIDGNGTLWFKIVVYDPYTEK
ncbi:MAG: hypothetical protein JXA19_01145 [Anaerolineales bacterium]|nr:hypothetical protein [Anaerolineales bacterium]